MTERIELLREQSVTTEPSLTVERALIETAFYKKYEGRYPVPVMRARNFYNLCARKRIYIGDNELIVGERGPKPKAVPTFPELNCHSVEDFKVLRSREIQHYSISDKDIARYEKEVIPFWKGRTQRDRIFGHVPSSWKSLYEAGVFTEFMEQRAPGHTALDGKMYRMGMKDFKARIAEELSRLDFLNDPEATDRQDELNALRCHDSFRPSPCRGSQEADSKDRKGSGRRSCIQGYTSRLRESGRSLPSQDQGAGGNSGSVYEGPGKCTFNIPGGSTDVLVLPSGNYSGTQRLGCHEPRSFRPASCPVLRKGGGSRIADT